MPAQEAVRVERRDPATWLTIDRAERRNALGPDVIDGLLRGLGDAAEDPGTRAVVLTGAGTRAFSAGGDLGAAASAEGRVAEHERRGRLGALFVAIAEHPKPVVARVNGQALAGGLGLALACDLVVAAETAEFGTPEVNVGLWPFMVMAVLARNVPRKVAVEMMLTGRRMSAAEAARWGLVNRVAPPERLDAATDELVQEVSSKSPLVLRLGKQAWRRAQDMSFDDALAYLHAMLTVELQSEDAVEGVTAFVEKRAPGWKGR
jgi:enoyl-CoA hydratase/carnithine racemase